MSEDAPTYDGEQVGRGGENDYERGLIDGIKLLSKRVISFHPAYARIAGSVNAGLFLSQALYWSDKDVSEDRDGWFYKTQAEWEAETCLSRKEQETARKALRDIGVLEEKREGIPARLWYRVNLRILTSLIARNGHTGVPETGRQDSPKRADRIVPNGQSITESTQETTSERTPGEEAPAAQPAPEAPTKPKRAPKEKREPTEAEKALTATVNTYWATWRTESGWTPLRLKQDEGIARGQLRMILGDPELADGITLEAFRAQVAKTRQRLEARGSDALRYLTPREVFADLAKGQQATASAPATEERIAALIGAYTGYKYRRERTRFFWGSDSRQATLRDAITSALTATLRDVPDLTPEALTAALEWRYRLTPLQADGNVQPCEPRDVRWAVQQWVRDGRKGAQS